MADPLKIIRRLEGVTTDYAVFERDQVLTHDQLNSLAEYLDDQGRLTRTQLLGVGIVGGLQASVVKAGVSVSKGVGITTDGDLLGLPGELTFTHFQAYDESAPAYEPFYVEGKMLPLLELLPANPNDKREGRPLEELGDRLNDFVLLAFMESYENDPDLCTGGDCDNRGRMAHNTQRFLLIGREAAEKLDGRLLTGVDVARRLPRLLAARVQLGTTLKDTQAITTAEAFIARYRSACATTVGDLQKAISVLQRAFGRAWPEELPTPSRWLASLERIDKAVGESRFGVQYYHAFLKDMVTTWGELRDALFADSGVLCPEAGAFPKHLLLGALAEPALLRTGSYPAPWLAGGSASRQRLVFLLGKLGTMIASFALPATARPLPKIVPSKSEYFSLERRAVPCYYASGRDAAIRLQWNEARLRREESADNFGYHWTPVPGGEGDDPFERDLGEHDFFRIEGHLGMKVEDAEPAIERLIRQRNLPIAVISVQLHNRRELVFRGPKFKKNSLHSLHYLLRKDIASHLNDSFEFSHRLVGDIKSAGNAILKPGGNVLNADRVRPMEEARATLSKAKTDLFGADEQSGLLGARTYKAFTQVTADWKAPLNEAVLSATRAKAGLGDIIRNDTMSPVDSIFGSKSHLWVDWLGDILKKREDDQKDRLLFTNMIAEHPGLSHFGGAAPGGTFVLCYDDSGAVIGDLALPYWLDDNDESDREEPELRLPDIRARLPEGLLPVKVIKPFELSLDEFKFNKIIPEIQLQENYGKFFRESLASLSDILKAPGSVRVPGGLVDTGDAFFNDLMRDMENKRQQLEDLRGQMDAGRVPGEIRGKVQERINQLEAEVANAVGAATRYAAVDAPAWVRAEAEKNGLVREIAKGVESVKNDATREKMKNEVTVVTTEVANTAESGGRELVNRIGGMF
ncbi:MAG TPA: hypothetical protein PK225_03315 [Azonexus sp.]|jgi:hypothetical protein|nr:hypothetical protein [Azonexus sp.]